MTTTPCSTCRFWEPSTRQTLGTVTLDAPGTCRRHAPRDLNRWPKTFAEDWCGDHERRQKAESPEPRAESAEPSTATLEQRLESAVVVPRDHEAPPNVGGPDLFNLDARPDRPAAEAGATAPAAAGNPAAGEGEAKAGPPSPRKRQPGARR